MVINLSKNRLMPIKCREDTVFFSKRRKNSSLCLHCSAPCILKLSSRSLLIVDFSPCS